MTARKKGANRGNAGKGRPKGSPNKVTKAVKDALRGALEASHEDGAEGFFLMLAKDDPKTFATLVGKLIPNEVVADVKSETIVKIIDLADS